MGSFPSDERTIDRTACPRNSALTRKSLPTFGNRSSVSTCLSVSVGRTSGASRALAVRWSVAPSLAASIAELRRNSSTSASSGASTSYTMCCMIARSLSTPSARNSANSGTSPLKELPGPVLDRTFPRCATMTEIVFGREGAVAERT